MITKINKLETIDLIKIYSQIINELKHRKVIRTKNLIGEMGEYLVIDHYNKNAGLPKLTIAAPGTKSIDAVGQNGKRYSIKSTSSKSTSVFYGLNAPNSIEPEKQLFEYVILAVFNEDFALSSIVELNWEQFLRHKKWHSTMNGWKLTITRKLMAEGKIIHNTIQP
jgi:hypothetical protein